jgi:hypothetical protein
MDDPGLHFREKQDISLLQKIVKTDLSSPRRYRDVFYPGLKDPWHDAELFTLSHTKFQNVRSYTSTPSRACVIYTVALLPYIEYVSPVFINSVSLLPSRSSSVILYGILFLFGATVPTVGQGLLNHEVSISHTTTHHSR